MIFGTSEVSENVDLGEETKTMVCKFVVRASSGTVVDEISADIQTWLDDLTDNAVRGVSDEEVEVSNVATLILLYACPDCLSLVCGNSILAL